MSYKSLNLKIALILIAFGVFLLTILFFLIVPKMEKQRKDHVTKQVESMITLTTQQLKLATKAIQENGDYSVELVKSVLETKVENIHHKLEDIKANKKQEFIKKSAKELGCDFFVIDTKQDILFKSTDKVFDLSQVDNNKWVSIYEQGETVCPKAPKRLIFAEPSHKDDSIMIIDCPPKLFNSSVSFEYKLKKDIQHSFTLTQDLHKGKIYLMWINVENAKNSTKPLFNKQDDRYFNNKYCVSKISNLDFPRTGELTGKDILNAIDKEPIKHMLDKDNDRGNYIHPALTWVRFLEGDEERKLLFVTTILEEDFNLNHDSSFWRILPTSLLALFTAILVGLFIFRRLFKTMNILTDTAKEINEGNLNVRSNIKGEDDIGLLGTTFDNMLDSLEKNITELDKKVEGRTKELKSSLEEKETLLKEIHHRVKNNLAMIIELIKIQKSKLNDSATKEALIDIQERVFTMELLHRKLYESKDLHFIDFKKYVLDLVNDLNYTYGSQKEIQIEIQMDNLNMSVEYALPCGLIINECITNSFKYAFNENNKGKIFIILEQNDDENVLEIGDSGEGISDSIDINKPKTLGLKLISTIVKNQLLGSLEYSNRLESVFKITFKTT